jgi:hypothetical protein
MLNFWRQNFDFLAPNVDFFWWQILNNGAKCWFFGGKCWNFGAKCWIFSSKFQIFGAKSEYWRQILNFSRQKKWKLARNSPQIRRGCPRPCWERASLRSSSSRTCFLRLPWNLEKKIIFIYSDYTLEVRLYWRRLSQTTNDDTRRDSQLPKSQLVRKRQLTENINHSLWAIVCTSWHFGKLTFWKLTISPVMWN